MHVNSSSAPSRWRLLATTVTTLALLMGACGSTESVTIESLGLSVEVDIQAGSEFELAFPLDQDTSIGVVSAPPGVTATITEASNGESMLLAVAVDAATPRGAYNLALLATRNGEDYELGWPFDVVEPVGAASPTDPVATTQPGVVGALLTVDSPLPGAVFTSSSTLRGETSSPTVGYRLNAGDIVLAEGTAFTVDGTYATTIEFASPCCIEMLLEVYQLDRDGLSVQVPLTYPEPDAATGLDLSDVRWVTVGPDGVRTSEGTMLWNGGSLFEKSVARDRAGGLVILNGDELWWYQAGETEPVLVTVGVPTRVVEVISSPSGPVARLGYGDWRHLHLEDGAFVDEPGSSLVEVDPDGREVWSAANGWSVAIDGPVLAEADEGSPTRVLAPARLLLTDETGAVLVNAVVGTDQEPWVRIHDFDGRTLIISRGPIEPAMADESFLVIDLACDSCTTRFTATAASATLVATDTTWNGPVQFSELTLDGSSG